MDFTTNGVALFRVNTSEAIISSQNVHKIKRMTHQGGLETCYHGGNVYDAICRLIEVRSSTFPKSLTQSYGRLVIKSYQSALSVIIFHAKAYSSHRIGKDFE